MIVGVIAACTSGVDGGLAGSRNGSFRKTTCDGGRKECFSRHCRLTSKNEESCCREVNCGNEFNDAPTQGYGLLCL